VRQEPNQERTGAVRPRLRRGVGPHWADVGVLAVLVLAVSVPTLAVEEDWHGSPMIDQPTHLWIGAAGLVGVAFLVAGVVAGYRRPRSAAIHATAVAGLALAVLVVGAVFRRLWLAHEGVSTGVARLWFLGVVVALLLSAAGSIVGRRMTTGAK
jgi:hypothetical protein